MCNQNVCRLCLSEKDLICIFENNCATDNKVIFVTTGVEILKEDIISKKICGNCCKVTIKMFEFRDRSLRTDKYLREQCTEYLKSVQKEPPAVELMTKASFEQTKDISKYEKRLETNKVDEKATPAKKIRKVHESVTDVFKNYPNIKLPSGVLSFNISPSVIMELNAVEDYFNSNNLNLSTAVQLVLKSSRPANETSNKSDSIGSPSDTLPEQSAIKNLIDKEESKDCESTSSSSKKVGPISIKLIENEENMLKVVPNDNSNENDNCDEIIKKNSTTNLKRRRLSSGDFSSESEIQPLTSIETPPPPTLMESLKLKPRTEAVNRKCHVCDSVQPTLKSLKKHIQEHFRCNFCRAKFRQLDRKRHHENNCAAKHALSCDAYVLLSRIDLDEKATLRYPALQKGAAKRKYVDTNDDLEKKTPLEGSYEVIIELSDDEDGETNRLIELAPITSTSNSIGATETRPTTENKAAVPKKLKVPSEELPKLIPLHYVNTVDPNNVQYCSTAIVKPDIKIKDNFLLNHLDTSGSDIKVFKNLLTANSAAECKVSLDGEAQTEMPSSDGIVRYTTTSTAELKGLLPQLFVFKVPVSIKKGQFNVTYSKTQPKKQKNMHLWRNMNPVDVKTHGPNPNRTYMQAGTVDSQYNQRIVSKPIPPTMNQTAYVPNVEVVPDTSSARFKIQNLRQTVINSASLVLNQSVALHAPNITNNSIPTSYYNQPAVNIATVNNSQHVANQGINLGLINTTSQHPGYLPQINNVIFTQTSNDKVVVPPTINTNTVTLPPSNAAYSFTNTNIPTSLNSSQQNLNVSVSYCNNNNFNSNTTRGPSTTMLPSYNNTLSGAITQSNPNAFANNCVRNSCLLTAVPVTQNVTNAANNFTNTFNYSVGQSDAVPSTSGTSGNVVTRPTIRVRNICELK